MKVAVLMGSANDHDKMAPAAETLARFGIEADVRVLSAHRNPVQVAELASSARENGSGAISGPVPSSTRTVIAPSPPAAPRLSSHWPAGRRPALRDPCCSRG